jgi:peroxiredoxin
MIELGELERRHQEFADRGVQVFAISNDDVETAEATQADMPHLKIVSDEEQNMANAFEVVQSGAGPEGGDTNAPTTFLVDGQGDVRWFRRPERFLVRLSPDEVLSAIDASGLDH